jgi:hypothetical protein
MDSLQLVVSILSGLITCIPLVIELIKYIEKAMKEKNWTSLMQMTLQLMSEAEGNFQTGEEKKAYVMNTLGALQRTLNYDIDEQAVSDMIDSICLASKKINT